MRRRLEALGVPVPRYAEIGSVDELDAFARRIAGPVVVKAVRGGYDGRGVRMARDPLHAREIATAFLADGVPVMAEEQVNLRRELSALVARSPFGQGAAWPVVETVQRDGICVQVIAPAPELSGEQAAAAQRLALRRGRRPAGVYSARPSWCHGETPDAKGVLTGADTELLRTILRRICVRPYTDVLCPSPKPRFRVCLGLCSPICYATTN
ncbi:ATP-grasp domain-containing protein [Mycobacterium sp. 1482292.6]|uniref:ATP-grasp domain-containing protein n=1 Tax=Mycobacterium sp. 1482292.6 TaxID=1834081 RepID=UPI001E65883A|nr:ATP-grasp domain-containing protein [Mycobacterium sp. 1482292.6]